MANKNSKLHTLCRILRSREGIAVSLLEATAVIAVGAILMSAASTVIASKIQDARISSAQKDVAMLGGALGLFNKDLSFYPVFKSGTQTSPTDTMFFLLASANGDAPEDKTPSQSWKLSDSSIRDSIENQLSLNNPGGSGKGYPERGQLAGGLGWFGPYVNGLGATDPWGNKYLVNVQFLTSKGVAEAATEAGDPTISEKHWAVFVLSAGPNEMIQTSFRQRAHEAKASGDDIIFRVQ